MSRKNELTNYFPNVEFGSNIQVCGIRNVRIGGGSCVGDDVWLNVCERDDKIRINIGKCVLIGRRGLINTGGMLEIGDYCLLGPNVYISDVDHDYSNINLPYAIGGHTGGRSVTVEENCWFAVNSVVTGDLTVGRGSVIGANAVVLKDVAPFSVVVGNPGRVVKMYDPVVGSWVRVRTEAEHEAVLSNRTKAGIPSRGEYAKMLDKGGLEGIGPIVAGSGRHLLCHDQKL